MSRGLILETSFQPSPSRSMTPGRKFCTSTSALSTRRRATAMPSGFFKSSVRLRWFLCARRKKTLTPLRKRLAPDQCRSQRVPPGGSVFAPGGARDLVVAGGDPRARQAAGAVRRRVGHEREGGRPGCDAPPVPGLAHVLL